MAERDDDPTVDERVDADTRRIGFGRQGHEAHQSRKGIEQVDEPGEFQGPHHCRRMRAERATEKWAFQVHPDDLGQSLIAGRTSGGRHPIEDRGVTVEGHRADRGEVLGHPGREESAAGPLPVGTGGDREIDVTDPVDLQVHIARHQGIDSERRQLEIGNPQRHRCEPR